MFDHWYFLGLLTLAVAFLFYRHRRYYLVHAYVPSLKASQAGTDWRSWVQDAIMSTGWVLLILAASGMTWGFMRPVKVQKVHKYVLVNDGSGSMVDQNKDRGKGKNLEAVHKGNKVLLNMLATRNDGSKDTVGAVVFSDDAWIVSFLVDDPAFIEKKLNYVDYKKPPMGGGTNLEKSLWAALELLLRDGRKVSDDEILAIQRTMYGAEQKFARSSQIEGLIEKHKPAVKGGTIVIFTDGMFSPHGNQGMMSTFKLLDLCKELDVRVYIISVAVIDPQVMMSLKSTGGFGLVLLGFDKLEQAYQQVVESQTQDEVVVDQPVRKSLSPFFGLAAFSFLMIGMLLRLTINRSYTEV